MGLFSFLRKKEEILPPVDLSVLGADMHSHLIPGIDDGSRSLDESIAILAKFESLGYKKVITTPHIMSEVYPNKPENILGGLDLIRNEVAKSGIDLLIDAGAEYFLDDTIVKKAKDQSLLSFGERYVLVEYSFHTTPLFENQLFFELQVANYKPVLAHFERYVYYHGSLEKAKELRERGICIQLNLNSLTGHYGPDVRKQAERMIDEAVVDFAGTDCHRIEHLQLLEKNLTLPYFHKLLKLPLKNRDLL